MSYLKASHNTSLAKLMASENLEVVYGSYPTASFDPVKRILRLPVFKTADKNTYDLMTGHEVGHALFTPISGWKHGIEIEGLPPVLLNIIEDVRIERLVQSLYPGLVRCFKLGYKNLFDNNFFGTKDRDIASYGFLDRLNINAKLRDLVPVSFSDEEKVFVDRSEAITTWEQVIDLCNDIKAFLDSNEIINNAVTTLSPSDGNGESDQEESQPVQSAGDDEEETDESEFGESEFDDGDEGSSEEGDTSSEEEDDSEEESESIASGDDQLEDDQLEDVAAEIENDPFVSETDEHFRANETDLIEDSLQHGKKTHVLNIPKLDVWNNDCVADYKSIIEKIDASTSLDDKNPNNYKAFLPGARKAVNHMVKEFELRRSADRHARARSSTKGTLDTTKLHSYKYNDEIFRQVTTLADGKNHGLMVLVDFSASMMDIFDGTIKNAIQLAMFCRQVNIPFQVYGFTSRSLGDQYSTAEQKERAHERFADYDVIDHSGLRLYDLFNGKQRKSDFEKMANFLIQLTSFDSNYGYKGPILNAANKVITLGATPLDLSLFAMHRLIPAFQKSTRVQIMNLFVLTDGDSHSVDYKLGGVNDGNWAKSGIAEGTAVFKVNTGKSVVNVPGYGGYAKRATSEIYKSLKSSVGVRIFGFHMTPSVSPAYSYYSRLVGFYGDNVAQQAIKNGFRKNGYAAIPVGNIMDILYLMRPVSGEDDEFEVEDDISKQQLKKQFTKFMKAKKTNRLIFSEFGKMVA
jgi:hypothetical protein